MYTMNSVNCDVSQPEVLKYLNGEISFEAWLEGQQVDEQQTSYGEFQPSSYYGDTGDPESSSVFSSWGSVFTGGDEGQEEEGVFGVAVEADDEPETEDVEMNAEGTSCDEDENEMELSNDVSNVESSSTTAATAPTSEWNLDLPSLENIPDNNVKDNQLQGSELVFIVESLRSLISKCKIRKKPRKRHQRRNRPGTSDEPVDIVSDFQQFQFRKRTRKVGSRVRLPELLRMQMGQANLLVAKGDFKQAADICMEIVREAPSCGLPFKTLAFIYEEQGDKEMSLQYSLVSAFLECKDAYEWRDLAKKCIEAGNTRQAIACYDCGCRYAGTDISLHWERANLYFCEREYRKVLDIYQDIFKLMIPPPSEQKMYLNLSKKMSKLLLKYGQTERAIELLDIAYATCRDSDDLEGINMLCELLIDTKKFKQTVKCIATYCHIGLPEGLFSKTHGERQRLAAAEVAHINKFVGEHVGGNFSNIGEISSDIVNNSDSTSKYITLPNVQTPSNVVVQKEHIYNIPPDFPLDLRVKLACSLIRCGQSQGIKQIMEPFFSKTLDEVGETMSMVGEAFYDMEHYEEALEYLRPLVDLEKYNSSKVWQMLAESYEKTDEDELCIEAYYRVLALAPLQASVRLKLAGFLRSADRDADATAVLSEYENKHKDDEGDEVTGLSDEYIINVDEYEDWYRKCVDMYSNHRLQDFIYHSYILMHNYLMSSYTYSKKQTVGKALVWELLLKTLRTCVKFKEFKKAITLVEKALLFKAYSETRKYRLELDYLQTTIYFVAGEYSKSFDCFRNILAHEAEEQINGNAIWNLFAQIVNKMLDKRHHRFTLRLLFKRPKLIPLIIQNGNNSHLSGTYKYAIGEFSRAFREWPQYPLNSLLLGVSYLHLSCQKFHKTRHTSILHGLIFIFQYFSLRGENQEACYNVGRAFHQIGLVHFAVHYYNKALSFPLHNEEGHIGDNKCGYHPFVDLHREAAFNLSLIYKASGNMDLARKMLHNYCWV